MVKYWILARRLGWWDWAPSVVCGKPDDRGRSQSFWVSEFARLLDADG